MLARFDMEKTARVLGVRVVCGAAAALLTVAVCFVVGSGASGPQVASAEREPVDASPVDAPQELLAEVASERRGALPAPLPIESWSEQLRAIAHAERALLNSPNDGVARARLEAAVGALAVHDAVLFELVARVDAPLERLEGELATARDEEIYGAVRGWYWVGLLRARDGRGDELQASLTDVFRCVATVERRVADLLADNAELVLTTTPAARAAGQSEVLERLAERHPTRADLLQRLMLAAASDASDTERRAFASRLVSDPTNVEAVARGLAELFAAEEPWLALEIAAASYEAADARGRAVITQAVVRAAPVDQAVAFAFERADDLKNAAALWLELGEREGAAELLALQYAEARSQDDDPQARRLMVAALANGDTGLLREAALGDPDGGVRAQAALVLTTKRDADFVGTDLGIVCAALDDTHGLDLSLALFAAENVFDALESASDATARSHFVERLTDIVLDDTRSLADRRRVLSLLEAHADAPTVAWLNGVLER